MNEKLNRYEATHIHTDQPGNVDSSSAGTELNRGTNAPAASSAKMARVSSHYGRRCVLSTRNEIINDWTVSPGRSRPIPPPPPSMQNTHTTDACMRLMTSSTKTRDGTAAARQSLLRTCSSTFLALAKRFQSQKYSNNCFEREAPKRNTVKAQTSFGAAMTAMN